MTRSPAGKRLLFVSLLPFIPDTAGGAEWTHLYLFQSLRRRGWTIQIICGTRIRSSYFRKLVKAAGRALLKLESPPAYLQDEDTGFTVWRGIHAGWNPVQLARAGLARILSQLGYAPGGSHGGRRPTAAACEVGLRALRRKLDEALESFRPDVVLGHYGAVPLLHHAALRGYLSFYFTRGTRRRSASERFPDEVHVIANTPVAAAEAAAASSREVGLLLSMVDPSKYRVEPGSERFITLINPIRAKGLDIAVEVARRMPAERFLFVRGGWHAFWESVQARPLLRQARRLGNVTIWDFQSDVRAVYRVTDILLVPSRRECFGRVILEAHINGIPVVAANVGGIAYTLGRGGILVKPDEGPHGYVRALRRLRGDRAYYEEISALSRANSRRSEFDPELQVDGFLRFIETRDQRAQTESRQSPAIRTDQGGPDA